MRRPSPPPLPEPPTVEEIWERAALPAPTIGVNPNGFGITGLETWLWTDAAQPIQLSVSLAGYTITGTATPVAYAFDTGDSTPTLSTAAGTEAEPAARHTYETKGTYTLHVSSVWTAEATLTGPEIPTPIRIDLGTATLTASRDYQVREIVTRLVD